MLMYNPSHPGPIILDLCMKPLGLTISEAAKKLGISKKSLDDIINCRAGVTADLALRLEENFGSTAEGWYRIQGAYDLFQAKTRAGKIKKPKSTIKPTSKAA